MKNPSRNILAVSALIPPSHSGAGRRVVRQMEALTNGDLSAEVWTTTPASSQILENTACEIKRFLLPKKKSYVRYAWFYIKLAYSSFRHFQTHDVDLIYVASARCRLGFIVILVGFFFGIPFIVGSTLLDYDDPRTMRLRKGSKLVILLYSKCAAWVLVSPKLKDESNRSKGINQIVIPNAVDTEHFSPVLPYDKARLRVLLDLPEKKVVVVCVGALRPRKGILETILSFGESCPKSWNGFLVIIGPYNKDPETQQYYQSCLNLVSDLGLAHDIIFLGERENIAEWMSAADIFLFMSKNEGFPSVLAEAMASGLPSVVNDIPGITSYILGDEDECGFIVNTNTEAANRLKELGKNSQLRKNIGESARKRSITKFDFSSNIGEYHELFLSAMKSKDK